MSGLNLISTYASDSEDEEVKINCDKPNEIPNRYLSCLLLITSYKFP